MWLLKNYKMEIYEVESVLQVDNGPKDNRNFLIKYLGYSEPEWEKENNLIGCKELVNLFLKTKNLEPMTLEEEEIEEEENMEPSNQITIYKVLQYIKSYRKIRSNCDQKLKISQLGPQPTGEKQLYIALIDNHFFVLLDNPEENQTIICDGANYSNEKIEQFSRIFTGRKFKIIEYLSQKGVDHCGSSAICIALEILRLSKKETTWPKALTTSKGLRNSLINRLHKQKVEALNHIQRDIKSRMAGLKCPTCGKQFKNRIQLSNHGRKCK